MVIPQHCLVLMWKQNSDRQTGSFRKGSCCSRANTNIRTECKKRKNSRSTSLSSSNSSSWISSSKIRSTSKSSSWSN